MMDFLSTPLFLLNKMDSSLHRIKHLTTVDSIFFHWIDTWAVYRDAPCVSMWHTKGPDCVISFQCHPTEKMWYLQLRDRSTFPHRAGPCSTLSWHYVFPMFLQKWKGCFFLNILQESWELLVASRLPSDCWVVFWTNESEKQSTTNFCTHPQKKEKMFNIWKCYVTMTKKRKDSPYREKSRGNDEKKVYESNSLQRLNHSSSFNVKNHSLLSATKVLSLSPMGYNTTPTLDNLTCTGYVDFGKCQDRFGQFFWSKIDSNDLDVRIEMLKRDDNGDFRLVHNLTKGEADFKQFMRLGNQPVNAAENFRREENLSPVLIPTMSKDVNEQLKLVHKVIDIMGRIARKIFVTLLRYSVHKRESSDV